jgi:uncharacterized protein (DUF1697 family)
VTATHVALLRGINVGKAKRIAMAELRKLFESVGCTGVKTLLNSGNVVFTAPKTMRGDLAASIEKAMTAKLGITARVTVITAKELTQILDDNPLREVHEDASRALVALPRTPADRAQLATFARQDWKPERCAMGKLTAYTWCANGILESKLWVALNKAMRENITTRNWATMSKLRALAAAD